uniref:Uncharacterized protein n=1 Tax=Florenciella parvula TaxID=236787 RepID=A0A7S2CC20_9STRA|mmetsp:Transcript_27282/g.56082  ORF Transcript_27282/g.56082 Transcript_27282/m.56082 type:complete len:163 (+) Transcript_27282:74-562(+)
MVFITKAAAALIALLATSTEALRPAVTPTMSSAGSKTPGRRDFLRLSSAVAVGTLAGSAPANAVKELCLPWDAGSKYYEVGSFMCMPPPPEPEYLSPENQKAAKAAFDAELAANLKKEGITLAEKNKANAEAAAKAKAEADAKKAAEKAAKQAALAAEAAKK